MDDNEKEEQGEDLTSCDPNLREIAAAAIFERDQTKVIC